MWLMACGGLVLDDVLRRVDELSSWAVGLLMKVIEEKAVNPSFGGEGEYRRAQLIESELESIGLSVERIDAPDSRVPEGVRPNIIAQLKGESEKTLWLISHLDTVPAGTLSLWETDPFKPVLKDGRVYGRGAEDNGQAIASTLLAARAMVEAGAKPKLTIGLIYASDEEAGSKLGLEYIFDKVGFKKDDLIVVPDAGNSDGSLIEVAEKGIIWLKLRVEGKEGHASMPHRALNAHRIGMRLAIALDELFRTRFSSQNPLFDPPYSTFEPTKHEANVENVNTIPGVDVLYFDCRVLPEYRLDDVVEAAEAVAEVFEKVYPGARVEVSTTNRIDAPPPTSPDSEVVKRLQEAIRLTRGIEAKPGGIGGGTYAAIFRARGYPAAVWCTVDETAHQPNEYAKVENLVGDAKVFAAVPLL